MTLYNKLLTRVAALEAKPTSTGGGAGTTDHAALSNLAYAAAAHTGFEPAKGADDNFVTDAEKVVIGNTSGTNTGDKGGILQTSFVAGTTDTNTTSTSYVDQNAMTLTITSANKPLLIIYSALAYSTNDSYLQLLEDSTVIGQSQGSPNASGCGIIVLRTPTAGSRTYKVQWKVGSGTAYNQAGGQAYHRHLMVIEMTT